MKSRTFMPATLPACLRGCKDFAAEDQRTQHRLALMLWMSVDPGRQHREYAGCATFTKAEMRLIWGSESAMYKALAGKHFLVMQSSHLSGYTRAFKPTDEMLAGLNKCLADPTPCDLLGDDFRPIREFPVPIAPFRAYSRTRAREWQGVHPARTVQIEVPALAAYLPLATPLERQMMAVLVRLSRNTIHPGAVPHRYTQYRTGRIFAARASLQFASKNIRAAGLVGCWDYDIANCHPTIIAALAARIGMATPALNEYIAAKQAIRCAIAEEAGITIDQAKSCLLMAVYGAVVSTSARSAITKEVGAEAAGRLRRSPHFAAIHAEIVRVRQGIIEAHKGVGGWVVNALGLRMSPQEPARVLLAHITQGVEALALRAIVAAHGAGIELCVHDGWVTRQRLDVIGLEEVVRNATGIPLRIEERRLAHPATRPRVDIDDDEPEIEIPLEDQELAMGSGFSFDSSSPLSCCPLPSLRRNRSEPHDGLLLSLRAKWNYLPN